MAFAIMGTGVGHVTRCCGPYKKLVGAVITVAALVAQVYVSQCCSASCMLVAVAVLVAQLYVSHCCGASCTVICQALLQC